MAYYIQSAKTNEGQYICPNCNVVLTYDQLIDKCDYCGSKFDVDILGDKISSAVPKQEAFATRKMTSEMYIYILLMITLTVIGIAFVALGACIGFMSLTGIVSFLMMRLSWMSLVTAVFPILIGVVFFAFGILFLIGAIVCCVKMAKKNTTNGPTKTRQVELAVQKNIQDFSMEGFLSSVECKIRAIYLSDVYADVAPFVECDLNWLYSKNANVIECECGTYSLKDERKDELYQYVEMTQEVYFSNATDTVRKYKNIVKIVAAKSLNAKPKNDVSMYRCADCGATISLVSGGKCAFCGHGLHLMEYDWIIKDFSLAQEL